MRKMTYFYLAVAFFVTCGSAFAEELNKMVQRYDVKKKLLVKKLTEGEEAKLRNYSTISFFYKGKLVYCHLSKDQSDPQIICH